MFKLYVNTLDHFYKQVLKHENFLQILKACETVVQPLMGHQQLRFKGCKGAMLNGNLTNIKEKMDNTLQRTSIVQK